MHDLQQQQQCIVHRGNKDYGHSLMTRVLGGSARVSDILSLIHISEPTRPY